MKILSILSLTVGTTTLFTSVHAQHHLPAAATSNYNGINSPKSSNVVDIEGVATISDEASDSDTARKLHDVLTSVKDIMDEEFGLTTTDGDGSGRRLSKSHKSDKGIDIIEEVLLLIILLVAEFLGLGGNPCDWFGIACPTLLDAGEEEDTTDEITAAHHGHDGSSSKTAKSEGTDGSAKTTKESKSSKSGGGPTCSLGPFEPGTVAQGDDCSANTDCIDQSGGCRPPFTGTATKYCGTSEQFGTINQVVCSVVNTCDDAMMCESGEICRAPGNVEQCTLATRPCGVCLGTR